MQIMTYRPTTQTLRYRTTLVNDDITTRHPHKPLVEPKQRSGGGRPQRGNTQRAPRWRAAAGDKNTTSKLNNRKEKKDAAGGGFFILILFLHFFGRASRCSATQ